MVVRFELSLFGMIGLTVVTACIFLWMFIIGIWAGQTILQPEPGEERTSLTQLAGALRSKPEQSQTAASGPAALPEALPEAEQKNISPAPTADQGQAPEPESAWTATEPSFFALQVSALRDPERAQQEMNQWRAKGYEAFLVTPEDKEDPFVRVYVGKFDKLTEADKLSAKLEKEEKVKAYIALLPASRLKAR